MFKSKYHIAQKYGKLIVSEFGKKNVGEFTIANISYFGIWLSKILANDIRFAMFTKVFPTKLLHYTVHSILSIVLQNKCKIITYQ